MTFVAKPPPTLAEMVPDAKLLRGAYGKRAPVCRMQVWGFDFAREFVGVDQQGRLWRLTEPVEPFRPWTLTVEEPV